MCRHERRSEESYIGSANSGAQNGMNPLPSSVEIMLESLATSESDMSLAICAFSDPKGIQKAHT